MRKSYIIHSKLNLVTKVKWKNMMCEALLFTRPPTASLHEQVLPSLEKLNEPMEEYKHKIGTEAVTEIWAMGYRDLRDLENFFQ